MPRLLSNIRFWIVLFFLIRLYGITQAPLEIGHNWRQSTVTMVARNFLEIDNNILYPRIDIAGNKTGITGMEFPIFNYLIYLCSEIFGYQHWYGRLINLICSSLGLWFFFGLVKRYFGDKTALFSTIILAVSIWFQFSRKIMPDTFVAHNCRTLLCQQLSRTPCKKGKTPGITTIFRTDLHRHAV